MAFLGTTARETRPPQHFAVLTPPTWVGHLNEVKLATGDQFVQPLTLALAVFKQPSPHSQTDWTGLAAATLAAALPMLGLFMVLTMDINNSVGFSGIK